jgi:hypothetical protein
MRYWPMSRCTMSGRFTYPHTATASNFPNFLVERISVGPTNFRRRPALFSGFDFFWEVFFGLKRNRRTPLPPLLEVG